MNTKIVYLDHAAATPIREEVRSCMVRSMQEMYGNPSSIHQEGRKTHQAIEYARESVALSLDVAQNEIIFTGSGTEANNLAIFGSSRIHTGNKKHILVSTIEHKSVLETVKNLADSGYDVEYVPVDGQGVVDVNDLAERLRDDTILVSIMYANNEIGTIQPIQQISSLLHSHYQETDRPIFHTDACQAAGQLAIAPRLLGVDLMTLNAGKIYGPKGVGILYVRSGIVLSPQILGGYQEFGKRAGTENIMGIIGLAEALKLAVQEQVAESRRLTILRESFIRSIKEVLPQTHINGHRTMRLPNNIHISFPYIEGEALVLLLDVCGICTATGSACSARDLTPSHVLRAIGIDTYMIHGSIRMTLGRETSEEDIPFTTSALVQCVERLSSMSALPLSHE